MYPFLPKGTALETTSRETPRRRRSNPLRALVTRTGDLAVRATWSPTR